MVRNEKSTRSSKGKKSQKAQSPSAKQARRDAKSVRGKQENVETPHLIDDRTRRDIWGVVFAVAAVALFVTAVMPANAVVTSLLSQWLHLLFGIGAYILPFILLLIGVSFVIRFERERVPARVAIGLLLLFIALLGLLGTFTPNVTSTTLNRLFLETNLVAQGGYVGAGIAWVGLSLLGQVVTVIILIGLVVISFLIIGFSLSKLIEKARQAKEKRHEQDQVDPTTPVDGDGFSHLPADAHRRTSLYGKDDGGLSKQQTRILAHRSDKMRDQPTRALKPLGADSAAATHKIGRDNASSAAMTRKLGAKNASKQTAAADKTRALSMPKPSEGFTLPDKGLLHVVGAGEAKKDSSATLRETGGLLQRTLGDFGVDADVVGWVAGPTVTLFKIDLPSGVRVNRITNLGDDIALALAAPGVRIFAPIPGTNYVGVEVPNKSRQSVLLGDVLPSARKGPLQIAIGKDVEGNNVVSNLAKMPHLLIGGTTGSGKSVAINSMIMSILMRATPDEVRLILIDPKRVEFTPYNGIPHLYVPVVTEPSEAASALAWGVAEMERRLKVLSKAGARDIGQYNAKVHQGLKDGDEPAKQMPYIVIVIDELADLMMNIGKEVEFSISRLAQLARAAGIHLIVATQRPSTNVVTGLIKANITNRIAFNVASSIDSRVILDTPGAESLIGTGDMLLSKPELAKPQRLQGCFVSEDEINAVVAELKEQGQPEYHKEILQTNIMSMGDVAKGSNGSSGNEDPLLWEAAEIVVGSKLGSTSNLQRRLKVGYSRAGRIMDMLEEKGIVGPANGSKPREVMVDAMELESVKAFEAEDKAKAGL